MSNLLAPNGKPSNLTPEQYKLVRTPEFKAWFGDWENQYKSTLIKSIDGRLIFDGKDIGIFEITKKSKSVEIDRLYIDKELQGKGIGKACIQYLFNNYEIDLVELYPHPYTQSFWLKNGVVNVSKDGFFEIDNKKYSVSKVVDENGEPLVVYHGSYSKHNIFNVGVLGEIHFIDYQDYAKQFGKYVYECFLNIKNPFYIHKNYEKIPINFDGNIFKNFIKSKYLELSKIVRYGVFEPNQIKLADGTNTTFDGNNPDIRFEGGGIVNFVNSKSLTIKIGGDLYKVQYRRNELGDTDKKVWFADVVSKNGEIVEYGRLSYDGEYTNVIYGFSLLEVENDIIDTFKNNDLYLITQDDYGLEVENRHIEFSNDSKKPDIHFDGGGSVLLAPNGKPSNLTPEQYKLVREPAFKKWFGDWENDPANASKVVDSNGEPLVVYHGTNNEFNKFDIDKIGYSTDSGMYGKGFYFSNEIEYAMEYANRKGQKGFLMKCFLNIKKPLEIKSKFDIPTMPQPQTIEEMKIADKLYSSNFRNFLINKRYDGVIISLGYTEPNKEFVVLQPNQIKLADGTNTTFDGKNPDIRFEDGGLIGNTYTQIIYRAILSTETTTDIYAQGDDLAKIKSEYNSISADDFDNPNSSYNSKILESITNQFEFIGDDSLSAEDYIDNLEDTNYWDLVDEESNEIESDLVSSINKNTDEMIDEIREFIKEEYNIGGRYAEKYMTISVEDENEDFIADLNIRTADHSQNSRNNDNTSYNLSFVIANKNATEGRFIPLGEQYYYDDNANIEDIKMEIKGIIDDKIEVIKDKQRFSNGGSIKELSKKEKQIVIENQNKVFSDGLPMYKLSADGKWVMKLNSRTNKYNTHNRFDLFYEGILVIEREAYARENAKKVFEYLDNNGAELLNKSIYGSRYYIYKNNHIRVSNHHNQSEQTNKETGLSKYKSNEHNFYSYENDGWKEMINKIELINPDIRFNKGGSVIINPTEIECHKCHWHWKVKDGGDDLFICHKCNYDNTKFYKFEGLEGEKILDTISYAKGGQLLNLNQIRKGQYEAKSDEIDISLTNPKIQNGFGTNKWQLVVMYRNDDVINEWFDTKNEALKTGVYLLNDFLENNFKKGGRTISQTPAPKKDQIKGSDKNKEGSAKDLTSAKKIKFADDVLEKIQNSVDKHNKKHPNKKITLDSAKAVVRRGMGAYSSTHRPTISGGNENSRVAWGLARLNAFLYKIVNGKSKSGKYSQDNDLIEELGYKVQKYQIGGKLENEEFENSALFFGGFFTGIQRQGIGKSIIYDIFENNPKLENILLYTQQDAIGFWQKLGGEIIKQGNDKIGIHRYFIKINRNSISKSKKIKELGVSYKNIDTKSSKIDKGEYAINYGRQKIGFFFVDDLGTIKTDPKNIILYSANKEKYADGGDIQAYEKAMGISEFKEGGEAKPKKVYVSIKLDNTSKKIPNTFMEYFSFYSEKPFEELKNGKLEGLVGVSTSPNNIAEWFIHRDCLIVMDYEEFIAINETETINYYDPYQLMKNNLFLFKRLYANVSRYGEQEGSYVFTQTLVKILEKIIREINLEMNLAEGQKYSELYRISRFLSPYETRAFPDWIEKNQIKIESPIDLTNAILDFNKLNDNASYIGNGFENPVITFDELLPVVEKGVTNASSVYDSEQEIVLNNRELNIPKNSQLFFIGKDEVGNTRKSDRDELIEKYNLKELYKVHFVDRQQIQKYRDFWLKKEEAKFNKKLEQGREELELKKDQVLDELINYFLENSISYVKNVLEKEILDYYESLDFYDETDVDYVEQSLFSIPLVNSIINTYEFIIKNFWKEFIQKKRVENLDLYAFMRFYSDVESEIKKYFENNYDELQKLDNYRNIRGSGSLDAYRFERLLLKTINDYEKLPELIDYKELSKMYLDKMGAEIYRYYDKKDLQLISKYKDGGEADELNLTKNKKMENEILIVEMNMYFNDTSVNFKNKEIPLKLNPPKNQNDFIDWAEENNIEFEQWGDFWNWESELIDTSYGYTFEIPLFKYIEYMKTEKFYTGGELKKGIKTEMEHKDTLSKIKTGKFSVKKGAEMIAKDHLEENDKYYTHLEKMESKFEEGGKVESIHSEKGDIMVSLDDNWYSDDSSVELVPVTELIKFREFDRKVKPKYNKDNSIENINHLKFMFQKEGVKSPLIIEYSAEDNAVLIIEGNHRLNSAIDLGMEYLPARVVLKKYGKYSPVKIKNAMKVDGIKANSSNYIPSDLKPSYVGITGAKPIAYAEGGIIEGRLHSECGDDGCGRKFQVGENGHIIEAERDEAVIVADAFNETKEMTIEGTPSEIASALNVIGGGKNFDSGAKIVDGGKEKELPEMKKEATDTDVDDVIDSGSIIINRRSMADEKSYKVTGSAKQIASAINSINGNGVVIEQGAKIE